jgi:hypothetical protein
MMRRRFDLFYSRHFDVRPWGEFRHDEALAAMGHDDTAPPLLTGFCRVVDRAVFMMISSVTANASTLFRDASH